MIFQNKSETTSYLDRKNNWILPFISGLTILISLFTPIAYSWFVPFNQNYFWLVPFNQSFIWLWGVRFSTSYTTPYTQFSTFPLLSFISAIIISISILIIGICFILNAIKLKKHKIDSIKSEKNGFILAILLVILTIMWMLFFIDLWQSYSIGPSIIVLFFSAAIPFVKKGFQRPSRRLITGLLILGGVIVLVSLFAPAIVHHEHEITPFGPGTFPEYVTYEWLWMFGLTFFSSTEIFYGYRTITDFYLDLEIAYNSLLLRCSISIIIMGSLSLIIAVKYKIFQNRWKEIWLIQLTMAIMILIAATLWIIIADFIIGYPSHGKRSQLIFGFGIIGPYIGASLIMISAVFSKTIRKRTLRMFSKKE